MLSALQLVVGKKTVKYVTVVPCRSTCVNLGLASLILNMIKRHVVGIVVPTRLFEVI